MKVEPSQPLDTITLTWFCDHCGLPVGDGDGYIEVDRSAAFENKRVWQAAKKERTDEHGWVMWGVQDLLQMPRPVRWHVCHQGCDPSPESDSYWIDVERVRTLAGLLDLHGHMSEKNWTKYTDFHDIRRHLPDLYGAC